MILKDLLQPNIPQLIMARTYGPDGEDLLFGYCHWDGKEIISDDGEFYSVNEEVIKHEHFKFVGNKYAEDYLMYWFESKWSVI